MLFITDMAPCQRAEQGIIKVRTKAPSHKKLEESNSKSLVVLLTKLWRGRGDIDENVVLTQETRSKHPRVAGQERSNKEMHA